MPEASYRLALAYGVHGPRLMGKAKRFFMKGKEADTARLSCFPDSAYQWRKQAQALLKKYHPCGNPDCSDVGHKVCQGSKNASYCGRDCQTRHWKVHKK